VARNKPTLTKHDIMRAIKGMSFQLEALQRHVLMIDDVLDKYIRMNKDDKKLVKYLEKVRKEQQEKAEKDEQNSKRKQSGRSAKASK
tara:strand:- start:976 stop:1236 length:261 start_codon:yes stop_codon:yes gene_type:complete